MTKIKNNFIFHTKGNFDFSYLFYERIRIQLFFNLFYKIDHLSNKKQGTNKLAQVL